MRLILVLLKHPCSTKRNSKLYVQACCGFLHETIAYLKGNSKIKEKFFKEILTQK